MRLRRLAPWLVVALAATGASAQDAPRGDPPPAAPPPAADAPPADPPQETVEDVAAEVPDAALAERVMDALRAHEGFLDADLRVRVRDGVVHLEGSVPTGMDRLQAEAIAEHVEGVLAVDAEGLAVAEE